MTDESQTDSLFTFNMEDVPDQETWSDIRLIHESDRGWCVVYSGLYCGRRVAIKGLKPEFQSSVFHLNLLQKEFEITSSLNHPNIVGGYLMADVPGIGKAILLEYVDGLTLTEYLASHETIDGNKIVDIISQVCSAVGYMHSRQTVHCDLKPSNIMITHTGFVKIIDFGISRGNGFERLDFPGGTKGYTAPENFDSESGVSVAVDIYSIGKLLEMMDCKGKFQDVWRKCLSPDPEKRPISVTEIQALLNHSLTRNRRRIRVIKSCMGVMLGISVIAGSAFLMSENSGSPVDKLSLGAQLSDDSERKMILKDLMLKVQNNVEISEEEKLMLDSISYKIGKTAYDCGNWLIDEAQNGGIKGADNSQWAPFHLYHVSIWLNEEFERMQSWVGLFLNREVEGGGIEVRFYFVCESQDGSLHALLREKLGLLPGEKRQGDFWWFTPADENLQKMYFVSAPDRDAIRSRIEEMLGSLNAIAWP